MPRRAPDGKGVTEHRITLGTFERSLITETKSDIEKTIKVATISAIALPVSIGVGGAILGYGLYKGGKQIGLGLRNFQLFDDFLDEGESAMGFLTFGLYDNLAKSAKEKEDQARAEQGLPPKEKKGTAENLTDFLLTLWTGKGILWGREDAAGNPI
mgnify:CR=1 FL=1|tara:strand:- start:20 stop:487 length:468 start_codon:yes stop_codon:yes gene_type:complete